MAFISPDLYSYPFTPTGFLVAQFVFMSNHVLLLVGILGLARSGVAGTGLLGRVGCGSRSPEWPLSRCARWVR